LDKMAQHVTQLVLGMRVTKQLRLSIKYRIISVQLSTHLTKLKCIIVFIL